jgi:dethiobiotin synthetase
LARILFVTGTDTGVGKTVCTGWLLYHLRQHRIHALAMKPLCSGDRSDVSRLQQLQKGELSDDQCNPYHFRRALAPGIAARIEKRKVTLRQVMRQIESVACRCDLLLVEGAGGVMEPAGQGFHVMDLIAELACDVVVVGRNTLGTINHTLLTLRALRSVCSDRVKLGVVLMNPGKARDPGMRLNGGAIAQSGWANDVVCVPYLGPNPLKTNVMKNNYGIMKKVLARILD